MRLRLGTRLVPLLTLVSALLVGACGNVAHTEPGDPPADAGMPTPLGNGLRIEEINNPDSSMRPAPNQAGVAVTGATFIIQDTFAETGLAASYGTVYVQDFHASVDDAGTAPPYSGMEIYKPTFEPPSLGLAPGDVIDFIGEYQQFKGPTKTPFDAPDYIPEMYEPVITFRFDYSPPQPTYIPHVDDLQQWSTGYKWQSMLVTVGPTTGGEVENDGQGRCYIYFTPTLGQDAPRIDNELFDLNCGDPMFAAPAGTLKFKSITGIVNFFYGFTISPRSMDDIVLE